MDRKKKKIIIKRSRTPKKKNEMKLTDRIRDAVNELKRYESREILREVNQITTPVSSPAYSIIKRYGKSMKIPEEKYTGDSKYSSYGRSRSSSPSNFKPSTPSNIRRSPRNLPNIMPLFESKEISLAAYLQANARNAISSKKSIPGKYLRNQSEANKGRNKSSQKSPNNAMAQSFNKNRRLSSRVDKKNNINRHKETAVRYATIIPVHEMMNQKEFRRRYLKNSAKVHCPGCLQNAGQSFQENRTRKQYTPTNNKQNMLTYYFSPNRTSFNINSGTPVTKKGQPITKLKKKKVTVVKRKEHDKPTEPNATISMSQTPRNIKWNHNDIKAFRMIAQGKSDDMTVQTEFSDPTYRSSQHGNKTPTIMSPRGCGEVSYRMCKQCPLRQLISKIDPAVGQDKKSYPVVAFTCCRKPPNVRSTATST